MRDDFDAKRFLAALSQRPGVYRMTDAQDQVIYVGKARNLKKRVASYFGSKAHHPKTQAMMNHAVAIEVSVTNTEPEALLLEFNLIKEHRPRFNVMLRDDKSYPYIKLTHRQTFPRFEFHRGGRSAKHRYFGPYPSAGAVRQTLGQLQKLFRVRQCNDSYFSNRSRPCLQYQIRRCTGPCVGLIEADEYQRDVDNAIRFLEGNNDVVLHDLVSRMDASAADMNYEIAAQYRDQIKAIKDIQARQVVTGTKTKDADVLAVAERQGAYCVANLMIRGGRMLGSRAMFPKAAPDTEAAEVLSAFIAQHYFSQPAPPEILISESIEDRELLESILTVNASRKVAIRERVRGQRKRWLELALQNAQQAIETRQAERATIEMQLKALTDVLGLETVPERIECFDISHTSGNETVASCVVFDHRGAVKSAYRRVNITDVAAGDDYAAIEQAVNRRYRRLTAEAASLPGLVLIDGGKGQLSKALQALSDLNLQDLPVIAVAKGAGRKAGREKIIVPGADQAVSIPRDSPALHLIQQIRDEAHRFAITAHRQRRGKAQKKSELESIPGLGPQRRRALLKEFGGLQGVRRSGVDDLIKVKGISRTLAEKIYANLHGG